MHAVARGLRLSARHGTQVRASLFALASGLHDSRDCDSGLGNRRQHRDLQRRERGAAAPAGVPRSRPHRDGREQVARRSRGPDGPGLRTRFQRPGTRRTRSSTVWPRYMGGGSEASSCWSATPPSSPAVTRITEEFFHVMGVQPAHGPAAHARGESVRSAHAGAGQRRVLEAPLRRRPACVGREIRASAAPFTIIGVMPPGFAFPRQDCRCLGAVPIESPNTSRSAHNWRAVARLKPGVTAGRRRRRSWMPSARGSRRAVPAEQQEQDGADDGRSRGDGQRT